MKNFRSLWTQIKRENVCVIGKLNVHENYCVNGKLKCLNGNLYEIIVWMENYMKTID